MIHRHKRGYVRWARCGIPKFPVYATGGDAVTCPRCLLQLADDVERSLSPPPLFDTGRLIQSFQDFGVSVGKASKAMVQLGTDLAQGRDYSVVQRRRR